MLKSALTFGVPLLLGNVSDPAPPGFELWFRNLLYIAGIAYFGLQIWAQVRRKPSIDVEITNLATKDHVAKIEMRLPDMATKDELKIAAKEIASELQRQVDHLDQERRNSIGAVHRDLKQAQIELASVATEAETHTRQISNLDTKIDRILERLPRRA